MLTTHYCSWFILTFSLDLEFEIFYLSEKALGVCKKMMHAMSLKSNTFTGKNMVLTVRGPSNEPWGSPAQAVFMFFLTLGSCLLAAPS